jgi:hypothetical protein
VCYALFQYGGYFPYALSQYGKKIMLQILKIIYFLGYYFHVGKQKNDQITKSTDTELEFLKSPWGLGTEEE